MESYPALYSPASGLPRATSSRFVVGRSTRANLGVPDVAWSREQFAVHVEPGACYLEQLSQKAPTLVNGARLDGRRRLQHGDKITVTSTSLVYLDRADPQYHQGPADEPIDDDAGLTRKAETDGGAASEKVMAPGELLLDRDA